MSNKFTYSRTLRLNLHKSEHKKVYEILLAVDGSANAYIVNAILQYADSTRASPEELIAQEVVKKLMDGGMIKADISTPSTTFEEVEPNYDFCS